MMVLVIERPKRERNERISELKTSDSSSRNLPVVQEPIILIIYLLIDYRIWIICYQIIIYVLIQTDKNCSII